MRFQWSLLLLFLGIFTSNIYSQHIYDQETENEIWNRLLAHKQRLSDRQIKFKKLNRDEASFAVNPSFESYYNPSVKVRELDRLFDVKTEGPVNEEVALDPFEVKPPQSLIGTFQSVEEKDENGVNDIYFITIVSFVTALSVFTIIATGFCYQHLQKKSRAEKEVEYPSYGVTGPGKETSPSSGDRKLAQSAQMYHYQHQKKQMIAFDRNNGNGDRISPSRNGNICYSEGDSEEEGDYTVYECPGLASIGEMEVRNPLFHDESLNDTKQVDN